MNFITAMKICLASKYVCFEGRASRAEYWYFQLFVVSMLFAVPLILLVISTPAVVNIYFSVVSLAIFLPSLGVNLRRLHDTDRSGWWYLLVFTGIGSFVILYWAILAGDDGENNFGPDPLLEDHD